MTGEKIYDLGRAHIGERYLLGALVPKDDPEYSGPWDCAEFATWIIFQLTKQLYGCANNNGNPNSADAYSGFWDRDAQTIGRKVTIAQGLRIRGAVLIRAAANGQLGHVAICDGKGGTIEAHSRQTGVVLGHAKNRRWDYAVLIPWIEYTEATPVPERPPLQVIYRYTSPMMKDPADRRDPEKPIKYLTGPIAKIQKKVALKGKKIDGIYGPQTFNAVREFQQSQGLVVDGEVGPITMSALGII